MSMIELRDVKYVYQSQYQRVEALRGISCAFEAGKVYAASWEAPAAARRRFFP